jgi:hypothetical protein
VCLGHGQKLDAHARWCLSVREAAYPCHARLRGEWRVGTREVKFECQRLARLEQHVGPEESAAWREVRSHKGELALAACVLAEEFDTYRLAGVSALFGSTRHSSPSISPGGNVSRCLRVAPLSGAGARRNR